MRPHSRRTKSFECWLNRIGQEWVKGRGGGSGLKYNGEHGKEKLAGFFFPFKHVHNSVRGIRPARGGGLLVSWLQSGFVASRARALLGLCCENVAPPCIPM